MPERRAHPRGGDAIAAARRQLPTAEVDRSTPLVGGGGVVSLIDAFEGRTQLFASYHMWPDGRVPPPTSVKAAPFFTGPRTVLSAPA
ncbi:DUF899 family protein [Streptomyces umbrinus]